MGYHKPTQFPAGKRPRSWQDLRKFALDNPFLRWVNSRDKTSQYALSAATGIREQRLAYLLSGLTSPTLAEAVMIERATGGAVRVGDWVRENPGTKRELEQLQERAGKRKTAWNNSQWGSDWSAEWTALAAFKFIRDWLYLRNEDTPFDERNANALHSPTLQELEARGIIAVRKPSQLRERTSGPIKASENGRTNELSQGPSGRS